MSNRIGILWREYGIRWDVKSSLICPKCDSRRCGVTGAKVSTDGAMRRRYRVCKSCGHRWQTVELDVERFVDLLNAESAVDSLSAIIRRNK